MEKISVLMDGELTGQDRHQALLRLDDTAEAREAWAVYHMIGDVLRREGSPAFDVSSRVADALSAEPTVLAPSRARATARPLTMALSVAASISAIAVVGWMAFSTSSVVNQPVELARSVIPSTPAPTIETQLVSAPSDGQMNEYLLAHQGVSPSTSLHGVAPYVRTISVAPSAGR